MTLEINFKKLDINNYDILQKAIEAINDLENTSALYLYLWKYYGVTIYFQINIDHIYFICKLKKDVTVNEVVLKDFYALRPMIKKGADSSIIFNNFIKILKNLTLKSSFYIDRVLEDDFNFISKFKILNSSEIAYLYELEKLKFFPGKKMQKKRNLLNFFNNNYLDKTIIKKYDQELNADILLFCKEHILKSAHDFREYEYLAIEELLLIAGKDKNLSGTIIYYDSKIIGVTLGYCHNLYYEIFLEKANKDFKGSYQFLISNNLILNEINTTYIDRQDGDAISGLIESKRSYKPLKIVNGNLLEINANDY